MKWYYDIRTDLGSFGKKVRLGLFIGAGENSLTLINSTWKNQFGINSGNIVIMLHYHSPRKALESAMI